MTEKEIEVGEYVRTKSGEIGIFNKYFEDKQWFEMKKTDNVFYGIPVSAIIKHSKIVSEVVGIGDYVNGYKILEITNIKNSNQKVFTICKSDFKNICKIWEEKDIETILTKEQMEANQYVVK